MTLPINIDPAHPIDFRHPLAQGLVGCWIAGTPGGERLYDLSPYANHGTLESSMTPSDWVPAQHGRGFGLDFDGSDDCVEIADNANLEGMTGLTVNLWFNADQQTQNDYMLAKWVTGNGVYGMGITDETGKKLKYFVADTSGTEYLFNPAYTAPIGDWVHYVIMWDGEALKSYVDGSQFVSDSASFDQLNTNNQPVTIGSLETDHLFFNGAIASPLIYNRALSPAEIRQLYIAGRTGDYPFLRSRMPHELWPREAAVNYAPPPHIFQPIGALS